MAVGGNAGDDEDVPCLLLLPTVSENAFVFDNDAKSGIVLLLYCY